VRTISTDQLYIQGEYYRVLVAEEDSYVTAVSVLGDDLTAEFVYAGTTIYGLFTEVSVTSGSLTAYIAGPTDIEDVWAYINEYGQTNAATIEAADCAKDAIAPLLDKYYAKASLVMVPSLYKTSIVYSERPLTTSGQLAFTRSNDTATRVGPDGYIEKVRTNLVLQSEAFDNAAWTKTNATITDNATAAPDGTLTADKLVETAALGDHAVARVGGMATAGIYTLSVFAKAGERTRIAIGNSSAAHYAIFDLSLGTVVQASQGTVTNGTISSIDANGFYRVSCTITVASAASAVFNLVSTGTTISYTGDGTSGLFIWGAQLETGDIATNYIPTTASAVTVGPVANLPRLNYPINSDGSVGCPSLLLEPQRTNLVLYSESFDNAAWVKVALSVSANASTSPDGYANADSIVENSATAFHFAQQAFTSTAVSTTYSIFAKLGSGTRNLILREGNNTGSFAAFNLSTGVVAAQSGGTATITQYANGYYRCTLTFTAAAGTSTMQIALSDSNSFASYAGNGTSSIIVYGAQIEAGAYATSYIPTLGASVTRGADACSKTGISSLIGQTQGTLFVEVDDAVLGNVFSGTGRRFLTISDNTTNNRIILFKDATNDSIRFVVVSGGVEQAGIFTSANQSGIKKIAAAYANNDFVLYVNGVQIGTDTSGTVPSCDRIALGFETTSNLSNPACPVAQALLFKTRLTNQELQDLTTL
jgi:hypothetical protein